MGRWPGMKSRGAKELLLKYRWLLLVAVLIAAWFYWYEWRPSQIRKDCDEAASKPSEEFSVGERVVDITGTGKQELIEKKYMNCLRSRGLNP